MAQKITEIIVTGKGSDLLTQFETPIYIKDDEYAEIGMKSFSFYNSIPNITKDVNNCLQIAVPGSSYQNVALSTGAYEVSSIEREIIEWIKFKYPNLKDVDEQFKLEANSALLKAQFIFLNDYGFNFDVPNSIARTLGFNPKRKERGKGKYTGESIVKISNVSSILINCSISEPNFINNKFAQFIFNCTINVGNGFRLTRELTNITYKNVNTNQISSVRIWFTDERGHLLDIRNEQALVTLSLRISKK